MKLYQICPLLLAISITFNDPCSPSKREPEQPTPNTNQVVKVSVAYPTFRDVTRTAEGDGTLNYGDPILVKSEMSTTIEKISVDVTAVVHAGDVLVTLSGDDLQAQIQQKEDEKKDIEARIELNRKALQDQKNAENPTFLDEENSTPPDTGTSPITGEKIDYDNLIKTDEVKLEAVVAEITLLQEELKKTTIVAPQDGIIAKKNASEGASVAEGDILFEIVSSSPMVLSVPLPYDLAAYVDTTSKAKVTDATSIVEAPVIGVGDVDVTTQLFFAKISVANADGHLKPGDKMHAVVATRKTDRAMMLPKKSIVDEDGKHFVYLVMGYKVQKTEVTLGETVGEDIEVNSSQIRTDDPVATSPLDQLKDGTFVEILAPS